MKHPYDKPMIFVESLTLDMPIATNCSSDPQDMNDLIGFGYFNADYDCMFDFNDDVDWGNDTVCVHSSITQAFTS